MKRVHRYFVAYVFRSDEGSGYGNCMIDINVKITTGDALMEVQSKLSDRNKSATMITQLMYLGKHKSAKDMAKKGDDTCTLFN